MQADWLEWLKVLAPVVTLFVTALLTVVGFFAKRTLDGFAGEMKDMRAAHEQNREDQRAAHRELENDFLKFQAQLPQVYTLKNDHIRHMTILEKKIDDNAALAQIALSSVASDIKLLLRETPKRKGDG